MTTVAERIEWLQQRLEDLAEATEEQAESERQRGREAGYQDGLNDAYGFVKEYLNSLDRSENDEHYLDALDDALITLRQNGAEDTTAATADDSEEAAPSPSEGDSVPAAPARAAGHADDDVAEA